MSVLPYGIATEKGPKQSQEDAYFIGAFRGDRLTLNGFTGPSSSSMDEYAGCFGVFDGHGGDRASRYCAEFAFPKIRANLATLQQCKAASSGSTDPLADADDAVLPHVLRQSILDLGTCMRTFIRSSLVSYRYPSSSTIDAEFCDRSGANLRFGKASGNTKYPLCGIEDGSTLVLAMIRRHKLYVVNVGDSRAVLCHVASSGTYKATALTTDHKPDLPAERARIQANGGTITGLVCGHKPPEFALHMWPFNRLVDVPRVDGVLSMTRAMGDVTMKPPLSAEPDVVVHALDAISDKFLILASDGLWDVVSNKKAAKVALSSPSAQAAAAALCKLAMKRGTHDNVTVLVVDLARFMHTTKLE
ncbi:hypothetical protein H257_10684 [Aphanomyces astaci]|uniref:PPM-type phosphatase domain-containing protein n=1 Tax=Aphanomyces astaci TaxID=112090 RepID=W4G765_APHAT|nr:hypothetical protein H257_10684 [Aphanomyces astaci]ETV75106.1 hypothetical protein H257_10684 [Aphanomyces astaci]|eukprot:XP_009835611.1 hypothetical protein H257_10684 [Aphanomyces astaci]